MKTFLILFAALTILVSVSVAEKTHTATVVWTDPDNPSGAATYSVYRATGLCSGSPTFSKVATALTALSYVDSSVTVGTYCFQITATQSNVESAASPSGSGTVQPFPPQTVVVTVN